MKRKLDLSVSLLSALCTITTLVCNFKKGFALKHIRHICEHNRGDYVKASPFALIVISLCIIFVLSINLVSALEQNEASAELLWSSQAVYSGDFVTVRITFTSSTADQLKIYRIGLHFGWMDENEFYTSDLTGNHVTVSGFGTQMFDPIAIQIPINVSAQTYDYFVGVDGTQGASLTTFSWDSSTFTLQIHSVTEKFYNQLKSQVEGNLTKAISANYQGSEAQSLLEQAQTAYNSALSSAGEAQWTAAISSLENASNYLDQASAAEQESEEQSEQMQSLLWYLVIVVVVVIVVVSVVVLVVRRRRRRTDSMAEQPMET
jgi:carbon starvation protein CstA